MDLEKAKRLLAKINVLVENADEAFSTLEHDLLKTYIKELYASISGLSLPVTDTMPREKQLPDITPASGPEESRSGAFSQEVTEEGAADQVVLQEYDHIDSEPLAGSELDRPVLPGTKEEDQAPESTAPEQAVADMDSNIGPEPVHSIGPELEALFVLPEGNDLASRLGAKPVRLVEDAMGINDRISTINDLFGRDLELFQATLAKVNACETYAQAREILMRGIASDQDWTAESRAEKATEFIRLVGRKFQSN